MKKLLGGYMYSIILFTSLLGAVYLEIEYPRLGERLLMLLLGGFLVFITLEIPISLVKHFKKKKVQIKKDLAVISKGSEDSYQKIITDIITNLSEFERIIENEITSSDNKMMYQIKDLEDLKKLIKKDTLKYFEIGYNHHLES